MSRIRFKNSIIVFAVFFAIYSAAISAQPDRSGSNSKRRVLRAALYPYVPEKASMYWSLETKFEAEHPEIDLQFIDLADNYYGGQLEDTLKSGSADVVEMDTVFLLDFVESGLIEELPAKYLQTGTFLRVASDAAEVDNKVYGIPHWVCGNFLFFRKDDPEANRFYKIKALIDLEKIIGRPTSDEYAILVDLRGKSTLGEKYLDAVLDEYQTPGETLKHIDPNDPDTRVLSALNRLFALCPGGLCDSDKHHEFGQFYSRQFAELNARALIGYSERLHYVVDHFLHGIREGKPSVGQIFFDDSNNVVGKDDIGVVPATLSDKGSKMLSWVDILCIRKGLDAQKKDDALTLIEFFGSEKFTTDLLIPGWGHAPRYLLPARKSIYNNPKLIQAAPIYKQFHRIMENAVSITGIGLNDKLKSIGKQIESKGFDPVE